jgi:O-antigen/teichoic acid export membrane protein
MNMRNVVFASLSAGSAVLMALVFFVAGQVLGTDAFGVFTYALAAATIGEALMDMGVHQLTVREVARDPAIRFELFRRQLSLKVVSGTVMCLAVFAVSAAIDSTPTTMLVVAVLLVSAVTRSLLLSIRGGLLGLEAFATDTALVVGDRVLLTIACLVALAYGAGPVGLAVVFLATRVTTVTAAFVIARPYLGVPSWTYEPTLWIALQQQALPLGAFMMVLTVYNYFDAVMLKAMTTDHETGLYNGAYRLYEGTTYAAAVLSSLLTPRLSNLWKTRRTAHAPLARLGLAIAFVLSVGIGFVLWRWAPLWMYLVLGQEYLEAEDALRALAIGLPFVFSIWVLHAVAISAVRDRLLVRATIMGLGTNIALNWFWIPIWGREGAAYATVVGEGVTFIVLVLGVWRILAGRDGEEAA